MPPRKPRRANPSRLEPDAADTDRIARQIMEISRLDLPTLHGRWEHIHGRKPPSGLKRDLIVRELAYRLQAERYGDLDERTRQFLAKVAKQGDAAFEEDRPFLKPGTTLVRNWKGTLQRVTILERGFDWSGQHYESLSAVARAITGSSWNGLAFFGLKRRRSDKGCPANG